MWKLKNANDMELVSIIWRPHAGIDYCCWEEKTGWGFCKWDPQNFGEEFNPRQTQKLWRGMLRGEECENSLVRGAGKNSFLQGWCPLGNKNLPPGGHPTSCTRKMWLQGQQWESERPWLDPQRGKRIVLEPQRQSSSGCISNALSIQKGLE